MSIPTHVFVTALPGRTVPIPQNEATSPGSALLLCVEGKVYRIPWSTYTRKRIAGGDLALCTKLGVIFKGGKPFALNADKDGKPIGEAIDLIGAEANDLDAHGMESDESGAVIPKPPDPAAKPATDNTRKG